MYGRYLHVHVLKMQILFVTVTVTVTTLQKCTFVTTLSGHKCTAKDAPMHPSTRTFFLLSLSISTSNTRPIGRPDFFSYTTPPLLKEHRFLFSASFSLSRLPLCCTSVFRMLVTKAHRPVLFHVVARTTGLVPAGKFNASSNTGGFLFSCSFNTYWSCAMAASNAVRNVPKYSCRWLT